MVKTNDRASEILYPTSGNTCPYKLRCPVQGMHVQSCLFVTPWTGVHQDPCPWNFPGKDTGVGYHFLW